MKKIGKVFIELVCVFLISILAGFSFGYIKDTMADADTTEGTESIASTPRDIHIEQLAERLKNNETRLYYMCVAEVQNGRARLAREDGQSWWINDFGFYQFEHVLAEMNDHGTYAYNDDTIDNVWRFE